MKKTVLFIAFLILAFSCDGETIAREDDGCVGWQIQVAMDQMIRLTDSEGNWIEELDADKVSLFATDQEWNYILNNSGEPLNQIPNSIEAQDIYDDEDQLLYIHLYLGQTHRWEDTEDKSCYFLLRINDDAYHQIIADYYTDCGDFILTKFRYNGTEYIANDWEVIDIVVEE